jgi:hypothetical protein
MKQLSTEQNLINRALTARKKWLIDNEPNCIFCLEFVGECGDLAHKIRRSYASSRFTGFEIQTHKKNVGLAHRLCHDVFDNSIKTAQHLPGFWSVMDDIKELDEQYYNKLINKL